MAQPRIFSTARLDAYAEGVLSQYGELVFATDTNEATMIKEIDSAIAFVVRGGMLPIRKIVIDQSPALKVIGRTGVGYDNIDMNAVNARKVPVIYTPGAGSPAVAEGAMTYMPSPCQLSPFLGR